MTGQIHLSDSRSIELSQISDISDIFDIQQNHMRMFCFTINLKEREIINVLQEYSEGNRDDIHQQLVRIHKRIQDYLQQEHPSQEIAEG